MRKFPGPSSISWLPIPRLLFCCGNERQLHMLRVRWSWASPVLSEVSPQLSELVAEFTNASRLRTAHWTLLKMCHGFLISCCTAARLARFRSISPLPSLSPSLSIPLSLCPSLAPYDQRLPFSRWTFVPREASAHPRFTPVRTLILLLLFLPPAVGK